MTLKQGAVGSRPRFRISTSITPILNHPLGFPPPFDRHCFGLQWGAKLYADVRSVFKTARRRGIANLQAIRLTLDEQPLPVAQ
jgi:hypothetical protein